MSTDKEAQDYLDLIAAAHAAGRAEAERDMAEQWAEAAKPVTHGGKSQAELEERRWGPGGREHFGDPRPGDYKGGPVKWAEPERPAPSHSVPSPRADLDRATERATAAANARSHKEPEQEKEPGA